MHSLLSAFFISELPLLTPQQPAEASRSMFLAQSQKNPRQNIYEHSVTRTLMQSVWQGWGGGSPTYLNARLWGRMVVVTTYKMHRFMQIMTFCLFALHNSQQGRGWRKLSNVPDRIFRNKLRKIERNLNSNSECWGGLIRYLAKDFWPKFFFF